MSLTINPNESSNIPVRLSKKEVEALNKLSNVVTTAKDPQQALDQLNDNLSDQYKNPLEALKLILAGKLTHVHVDGVWYLIKNLLVYSDHPYDKETNLKYVRDYDTLNKASNQVTELTGYNWLTVGYFTLLTCILMIVITIYKVKVLPVYASFFEGFGAQLPGYTQFILNGGYEAFSFIFLTLTFIYSLFFPFLFRHALSHLRHLPIYMMLFPVALACHKPYRQYCWQTFARVYHNTGESDPLQKAEQALWGANPIDISDDDWVLLEVASQQGNLIESLDELDKGLLATMKTRITLADMLIRVLLLLGFVWIISTPVIAMYLPIFQMGAVIP